MKMPICRLATLSIMALFAIRSPAADALDGWVTRVRGGIDNTNKLTSIAYGKGRFVAAGRYGTMLTSTNGIDWVTWHSGYVNFITDICFGNGKFVAVSSIYGEDCPVYVSSDGVNWTIYQMPASDFPQSVAYGNGRFVSVGRSGLIFTSPSGAIWSPQPSFTTQWLYGVAYGQGVFAAVGVSGVATSVDGTAWTVRSVQGSDTKMLFADNQFLAGGGTSVLRSTNGLNWGLTQTPALQSLSALTQGNGTLVGFEGDLYSGDHGLAASTNGIDWVRHASHPAFNAGWPTAAIYAQNRFTVVTSDGSILQSLSTLEPVLTARGLDQSNGFGLDVAGEVGRTYLLQYATNLAVTNWTALGYVTNEWPTITAWDTNAPVSPTRFYRAVIP